MAFFQLIKTCCGCPEQYDVFHDEKYVGYLRLRHGGFRCDNADGRTIYYTDDVAGNGVFEDDEREIQLTKALLILKNELDGPEKLFEFKEDKNEHTC